MDYQQSHVSHSCWPAISGEVGSLRFRVCGSASAGAVALMDRLACRIERLLTVHEPRDWVFLSMR